jgi:hypothetical protein
MLPSPGKIKRPVEMKAGFFHPTASRLQEDGYRPLESISNFKGPCQAPLKVESSKVRGERKTPACLLLSTLRNTP